VCNLVRCVIFIAMACKGLQGPAAKGAEELAPAAQAREILSAAAAKASKADGAAEQRTAAQEAQRLVEASAISGGLVVELGCGAGQRTAALRINDAFVVQAFDTDPQNVAAARRWIRSRGLSGPVSVDTFDGRRLPLVDNLVNLLVADEAGSVPREEMLRVLAPGGVAMVSGQRIVKPRPGSIDHWTHFWHGPDNNAVAEDLRVGPPRHMQWLAGPLWTRHHHADKGTNPAIRALVSCAGRLYYTADLTAHSDIRVPSRWVLTARDAFSGVRLWQRPLGIAAFERRLEDVWRTLVADQRCVYSVFGPDHHLAAFDGATGRVVREFAGTAGFREMVLVEGVLVIVGAENAVTAREARSGRLLWRFAPEQPETVVPLSLASDATQVYFKTDGRLCCLSLDEGRLLWQVALPRARVDLRLRWPREKLLVAEGVVLCSYGGNDPRVLDRDRYQYLGSHPRVHEYAGKLGAFDARDGRRLWETAYLPGLESMPGEIYVIDGTVWLGPDFARPRELRTGKVLAERELLERLWTDGHHYRCYPGKATSRYILTAKRGIEMFDLEGENHSRNNWVRATCRVGVLPCNGLIYAPPHSCGCYMETRLFGFWALAPEASEDRSTEASRSDVAPAGSTGQRPVESPERLERGPAWGSVAAESGALSRSEEDAWPTWRHDAERSGSTPEELPPRLGRCWQVDLGSPLSAPVVADGLVLMAETDAHTLHALDAETGQARWQFTAGGRIDSPPTVYRGLVLFGAHDGWVYCLRAEDGELVWRFLAAPSERRSVAFEQVESLWPVAGSVLVHRKVAYLAAGRCSYLDGGIVLWGLDPLSGRVRCQRRLRSEHAGAAKAPPADEQTRMASEIGQNRTDYKTFLAPDRADAFSMRGALADVLVAGGESIFMHHLRFDRQLGPLSKPWPHLFATSSLLDPNEHHRRYWVFGTGDFSRLPVAYPWIIRNKIAVPYGLLLVFDGQTVWGVRRRGAREQTEAYELFAAPKPDPADAGSRLPDFAARTRAPAGVRAGWSVDLKLRPRAMIRVGEALLVAGTDPAGSFARGKDAPRAAAGTRGVGGAGAQRSLGGVLPAKSQATGPHHSAPSRAFASGSANEAEAHARVCAFSDRDGRVLGEWALSAAPVFGGMAAARGRLYATLANGTVVCLGEEVEASD